MNGYQVCIFMPVYHNGKFVHNSIRWQTVHAEAEWEIKDHVTLAPPTRTIAGSLEVSTSEEYIHDVQYLGRVTWVTKPVYIKE